MSFAAWFPKPLEVQRLLRDTVQEVQKTQQKDRDPFETVTEIMGKTLGIRASRDDHKDPISSTETANSFHETYR